MAQEYVGGGSKKLPTYTKTLPVAPRKPLPSSNPRPATPPKKTTPAPKKKTTVAPKAPPKAPPAKPAPKSNVPTGKYADIYKDTHKSVTVPKTTTPAKKPASAPKVTGPAAPKGSAPTKPPNYPVVQAPTNPTSKAPVVNTPAKPPAVTKPTTPTTPTTGKAPAATGPTRLDKLWTQASGYKAEIENLLKQGFSYNPETDPAYQSMLELSGKQAKAASLGAMETMNDRGILNSTVTSDRLGQIEQTAKDQVTAAIPQLQQAAYGKYMDKIGNLYNLMNQVYGEAQNERGFTEDKRRWDLGFGSDNAKWAAEFAFQKQQADRQQGNWQQEFDFNKNQTGIENSLKSQGLELEHLRYQISEITALQSQQGYFDDKATQEWLASGLQNQSAEGAAQWLSDHAFAIYEAGGDINKIMNGLESRFKGFKSSVTGQTGGGGSLFP